MYIVYTFLKSYNVNIYIYLCVEQNVLVLFGVPGQSVLVVFGAPGH